MVIMFTWLLTDVPGGPGGPEKVEFSLSLTTLAQYLFNDFFPHKMIIFADIRFRLPMFWTYIMSPSVLFSYQIKIAHLLWQG